MDWGRAIGQFSQSKYVRGRHLVAIGHSAGTTAMYDLCVYDMVKC
jgi:hypothetical protein